MGVIRYKPQSNFYFIIILWLSSVCLLLSYCSLDFSCYCFTILSGSQDLLLSLCRPWRCMKGICVVWDQMELVHTKSRFLIPALSLQILFPLLLLCVTFSILFSIYLVLLYFILVLLILQISVEWRDKQKIKIQKVFQNFQLSILFLKFLRYVNFNIGIKFIKNKYI